MPGTVSRTPGPGEMPRLGRWWLPLLILLVWQGLCSLGVFPPYKLPSPLAIGAGLVELESQGMPPGQRLHWHLFYSLLRVALGFGAAALIAVPLGLLLGASPRLHRLINPLIELLRPVPPLAWIPISILWFGIGLPSAGFIIFLGAFFPIVLNTITGVTSVNPAWWRPPSPWGPAAAMSSKKSSCPGPCPTSSWGCA